MVPGKLLPWALIKFILENHYKQSFPNLVTKLQILLTLSLPVAPAERSFLKLKLLKTYLKSNMSQCRLTAEISIEIDKLKNIDISALIEISFNKVMAIKIILTNVIKNINIFHFNGASHFHHAQGLQSSKAASDNVCYKHKRS